MKSPARHIALAASIVAIAACSESTTGPLVGPSASPAGELAVTAAAPTTSAIDWNVKATSLTFRRRVNVSRLYAYLSLAQLRAAEDAEGADVAAAIAGASAGVLASYFPLDIAEIETMIGAEAAASQDAQAFATGEAVGRQAAVRVIAYSASDRIGLTDPGTPPTTPGSWQWSGGPIVRGNLGARPFFLRSTSELRPGAPPEFGSKKYLDALAEVRAISDTRTTEQLRIAQYWHVNQSGVSNAAMNNLAVDLIRESGEGELEAARTLFRMNAAAFDALIGCFDAKYAYWFIRPTQADPAITLAVPLPAHPSYPSAHSCVSGSATAVLSAVFPQKRQELADVADEASLSRLYGGLHYDFDMDAGLALGRRVARKAMTAKLDDVAVR